MSLRSVASRVVLDRRHLHAHPELASQEHKTVRFIAKRLRLYGPEVRTVVAETGVGGLLRGGKPWHDGHVTGGHRRAANP